MKIFSAVQIKEWDRYTIEHEPIASVDLMERASLHCSKWIVQNTAPGNKYLIFCGPGNNGGDGLAIARQLIEQGRNVHVFTTASPENTSEDFKANLQRLQLLNQAITMLDDESKFPLISTRDIVVDALFGYGLNRKLEYIPAKLVQHINSSGAAVIAIDIPSGLFADSSSIGNIIIEATFTLTFQVFKLAFLLPENALHTGEIKVIDIGLSGKYYDNTPADFEITEPALIHSFLKPRNRFSHKGTYGHAVLIAGSYGMMGAAVLSARACLRSGAGKLTLYIPQCGYSILQTTVPEAMCIVDSNETHHTALTLKSSFNVYGIGPGLGEYKEGVNILETLLEKSPTRLIIDADALNILSQNKTLYVKIPPQTILTPHPKEFERLFGSSSNNFDRLQLALQKAKEMQVYIVIKGNYSFIATPSGKGYFNPTGNPGMATAGSGDVLTGILSGLYAQYSDAEHVVLSGVYLHGLAGDIAARQKTEEAMIAGDIVECIPNAFAEIKQLFILPK